MKKSTKKLVMWAALIGGGIWLMNKSKKPAATAAALPATPETPLNDQVTAGEYFSI